MLSESEICFNPRSQAVFRRLPKWVQESMREWQTRIHEAVLRAYPRAVATSGFRDSEYNRKIGGREESRHLWGCARDYLPFDFPRRIPGLVVIVEDDHVHVEEASE